MIIGVDVGGTKTLVALFNEQGEIVKQIKQPTNKDYDHFLSDLKHMILETGVTETEVEAIAIALPGTVDYEAGVLHYAANLGWKEKDVRLSLIHI